MKDLMKHLPLSLSVLTFVLVGMLWLDVTPQGGCQDCTSMRGRMAQGMMQKKQAWGSKGDTGRMRREEGREGKRGPKKEAK